MGKQIYKTLYRFHELMGFTQFKISTIQLVVTSSDILGASTNATYIYIYVYIYIYIWHMWKYKYGILWDM